MKKISILVIALFILFSCAKDDKVSFKEILFIHYDFRDSDNKIKDNFYVINLIRVDDRFNVTQLLKEDSSRASEGYAKRLFVIKDKQSKDVLRSIAEKAKGDSLFYERYDEAGELYRKFDAFSCAIVKSNGDTIFQYGDFRVLPQVIQDVTMNLVNVSDVAFENILNQDSLQMCLAQYEGCSFVKMVVPPALPLNSMLDFVPPVVVKD